MVWLQIKWNSCVWRWCKHLLSLVLVKKHSETCTNREDLQCRSKTGWRSLTLTGGCCTEQGGAGKGAALHRVTPRPDPEGPSLLRPGAKVNSQIRPSRALIKQSQYLCWLFSSPVFSCEMGCPVPGKLPPGSSSQSQWCGAGQCHRVPSPDTHLRTGWAAWED